MQRELNDVDTAEKLDLFSEKLYDKKTEQDKPIERRVFCACVLSRPFLLRLCAARVFTGNQFWRTTRKKTYTYVYVHTNRMNGEKISLQRWKTFVPLRKSFLANFQPKMSGSEYAPLRFQIHQIQKNVSPSLTRTDHPVIFSNILI